MKIDRELTLLAAIVTAITLISCYAEFDTVRTKPEYAPASAYVHYPAPPSKVPIHPQDPQK